MIKEACVETLEQALRAEQLGADQIELCGHLDQDGLTPDKELTKQVLDKLSIPVKVMVRPRGGHFRFTPEEIQEMTKSIKWFKHAGVSGIVIGSLDARDEIDEHIVRVLAQSARPLDVTFHRAIDHTSDPLESARLLDRIEGITHILTSGGAPQAREGMQMLKAMLDANLDLDIIVAGGVTNHNLESFHKELGATYYHGRLIMGELDTVSA